MNTSCQHFLSASVTKAADLATWPDCDELAAAVIAQHREQAVAELSKRSAELENALSIGQENCDAEYDRLREERDEAQAAEEAVIAMSKAVLAERDAAEARADRMTKQYAVEKACLGKCQHDLSKAVARAGAWKRVAGMLARPRTATDTRAFVAYQELAATEQADQEIDTAAKRMRDILNSEQQEGKR